MTTKYVPTLGALSVKALVKNRITFSKEEITEDALAVYRETWLTSEARLFYIPTIYTPLDKELVDIAHKELDEQRQYLTGIIQNPRGRETRAAREKLEHINNIVLNQDIPKGYLFEKPERQTILIDLAHKIDKDPNNISETLISLLLNNGMKLNRGDLIFYEAASTGKSSLTEWFIIDNNEDTFFLHALLRNNKFSQPNTMKTITEFPPRYWYRYGRQFIICHINVDLFEDQINKNVIEMEDKKHGNFGLTFITYNNITYTIIIGPISWEGIKKGRYILSSRLKRGPIECKQSDNDHPAIKEIFDSNPYTTMMVV